MLFVRLQLEFDHEVPTVLFPSIALLAPSPFKVELYFAFVRVAFSITLLAGFPETEQLELDQEASTTVLSPSIAFDATFLPPSPVHVVLNFGFSRVAFTATFTVS